MASYAQAMHGNSHGAPDMDYAEHERTYRGFVTFAKWGTIGVGIIFVLLAIFLL